MRIPIPKEKFPHCLSEIGLTNYNENAENFAI